MKTDYQDNRSKLATLILESPTRTPLQEVVPVATKEEKQESHVNFWMPSDLMERLKIQAAKRKKTIKQLGIEAFEQYLQ